MHSYQEARLPDKNGKILKSKEEEFSSSILQTSPVKVLVQNWQQFTAGRFWPQTVPQDPEDQAQVTPPLISINTRGTSATRVFCGLHGKDLFMCFSSWGWRVPDISEWLYAHTFLQSVHLNFYSDLDAVDLAGLYATSTEACMLMVARVLLVKEERHLASFPFRSSPGKPLEIRETKWNKSGW